MASLSLYTYEPLPKGKHIRVLSLLPAEDLEAPVYIELRPVPMELPMAALDAYEALSYVWGDGALVEPIYCGGKIIPVTPNCLMAVRYLRRRSEPRTLWIDAICIDQAGPTAEKNHQVALMSDIYTGASKVLVWLGDQRGRLWLLMRICEDRPLWYGFVPRIIGRYVTQFHMEDEYRKYRSAYRYGPLRLLAKFDSCISSSYFTRAWTLQEMILATRIEFVCRHATLLWADDVHLDLFSGAGKSTVRLYRAFKKSIGAERGDAAREKQKRITEFYSPLTGAMGGRQSTRPHDKIFAMYGVLRAVGHDPPMPDYDKELAVVWEEFFRDVLVVSQSLHFLFYPQTAVYPIVTSRHQEIRETLPPPSWVPPYHAGDARWTNSLMHGGDGFDIQFRLCRLMPPTSASGIMEPDQRRRLQVLGKRLGTISTVIDWSEDLASDTKSTLSAFFIAWGKLAKAARELGQPKDPGTLTSLLERLRYHGNIIRLLDFIDSGDDFMDERLAGNLATWAYVILAGRFRALGPPQSKPGDVVVLLDGAPVEAVLRPLGNGNFVLVGRALAAGVAEECWNCFNTAQLNEFETFSLV